MTVLRGDLDISSAPRLGAYFDAAVPSGYISIVLDLVDLAELDLTGLAGLGVTAHGASRLVASGDEPTVRSASTTGARALDVTWLGELVRLELPGRARYGPGPEQSAAAPGTPVRSEPTDPFHGSRGVTVLPADEDVVDGALRLVAHLARATVAAADGVSVSLRRHGRLVTVAASDQTISDMDADQYATGQGPCMDASVNDHWSHVESLDQEARWPAFVARAKKLGISAVLSAPLMAQSQPVGALNIYSRTAFTAKDQELASVFATEASAILTDAGADVADDQLASLRQALAREVVALAYGVLMGREGAGRNDAYTVLWRSSQRAGRPLIDRAEDVVASTLWSPPDLAPQPAKTVMAEEPTGERDQC